MTEWQRYCSNLSADQLKAEEAKIMQEQAELDIIIAGYWRVLRWQIYLIVLGVVVALFASQ